MSALFSAKNREFLLGPLSKNNPVIVQVLGICSALAVTAKLEPAIGMGLSVTAVTAFSNVILSLIHIPEPTRRSPNSYAVFCLKKKNYKKQ